MKIIKIHPDDNVLVSLKDINCGDCVSVDSQELVLKEDVKKGHKIALYDIKSGDAIIKYGCVIGYAKCDISSGEWVHTHNIRTGLSEKSEYSYNYKSFHITKREPETFKGFKRKDGRAAVRNEIWIIPTVGCVNTIANQLVQKNQHLVKENVEGLYAFPHPFGCSQMGGDHEQTKKLLASLCHHPNAGGVLVLGLGCENLTAEQFKEALGEYDQNRIKFLVCQESDDEIKEGSKLLAELYDYANQFSREEIPMSELIIGMKCGGSDGLSGITANPTVGRFSDILVGMGGTTILTEVPEMFGAESILLDRAETEEIYNKAVAMITDFKDYFVSHNQVVYENPSPGNKAGGISTLEDKSCGCVQKGGRAPVMDVLGYGERANTKGLNLLSGPGNDLVSTTALTAAGAHIILFTTGRGTPFGAPAPTVKISTNSELYAKKNNWIDFNAGTVVEGESLDDAAYRLLSFIKEIASGEQTVTEKNGAREISIFKDGVVL